MATEHRPPSSGQSSPSCWSRPHFRGTAASNRSLRVYGKSQSGRERRCFSWRRVYGAVEIRRAKIGHGALLAMVWKASRPRHATHCFPLDEIGMVNHVTFVWLLSCQSRPRSAADPGLPRPPGPSAHRPLHQNGGRQVRGPMAVRQSGGRRSVRRLARGSQVQMGDATDDPTIRPFRYRQVRAPVTLNMRETRTEQCSQSCPSFNPATGVPKYVASCIQRNLPYRGRAGLVDVPACRAQSARV